MKKVLYILADLSDADVDWLAVHGERRRVAAGEVLVRQGVPFCHVDILLQGQLAVSTEGERGRQIGTLGAGEVVGELSFLDARPPSATVRALTDAVVLRFARETLRRRLAEDSGFAARFYRALGVFLVHRLRRTILLMGDAPASAAAEALDLDAAEEVDADALDATAIAGKRFEFLLRRFLEG